MSGCCNLHSTSVIFFFLFFFFFFFFFLLVLVTNESWSHSEIVPLVGY